MLSKAKLKQWISAAHKLCQVSAVPNKQATEILLTKDLYANCFKPLTIFNYYKMNILKHSRNKTAQKEQEKLSYIKIK